MKNLYNESLCSRRDCSEDISNINSLLRENIIINVFLNGNSEFTLILSESRQIVYANKNFLNFFNNVEEKDILGLRPGEAFNCIYYNIGNDGCGSSKFCRYCGAASAIIAAQKEGKENIQECKLITNKSDSVYFYNFLVKTTPFEINGYKLIMFSFRDISEQKYLQKLETVFFHNFIDITSSIYGIMEFLPDLSATELKDVHISGMKLLNQLMEEIEALKILILAERGELIVKIYEIYMPEFLESLCIVFRMHLKSQDNVISEPVIKGNPVIHTDRVILTCILNNLLDNALEASKGDQKISLSYVNNEGGIVFSVHNENSMTEEVKSQIFKRSFTTKPGKGRGFGLYCVKLLTERYLKGQVSFSSSDEEGTVFSIKLP